jgi:hypothetical protein
MYPRPLETVKQENNVFLQTKTKYTAKMVCYVNYTRNYLVIILTLIFSGRDVTPPSF